MPKTLDYERRDAPKPFERPVHICGSSIHHAGRRRIFGDLRWSFGIGMFVFVVLAIVWFFAEADQSMSHWNVDGPSSTTVSR